VLLMSTGPNPAASVSELSAPVFVVGPPRSGTTLVQTLLSRSARLHIVDETHYFDDLRPRVRPVSGRRLSDEAQSGVEDYFLALNHRPYGDYGDPSKAGMLRQHLRALAEDLGGDPDAYFEAFCRLTAAANRRVQWGEKTPRHIFRISDILSVFPRARVVCMVRDPRAIIASYRNLGLALSHPSYSEVDPREKDRVGRTSDVVVLSLLVRGALTRAKESRGMLGAASFFVQQYEELVLRPKDSIAALCRWLGIEATDEMLHVPLVNSSFPADDQIGFAVDAVNRWRSLLAAEEITVIQQCCGHVGETFGYEREIVRPQRGRALAIYAQAPVAAVRAARANSCRRAGLTGYVWRRLRPARRRLSVPAP
jgi:hypothetical protein